MRIYFMIIAFVMSVSASASNYERRMHDIKLPTQKMIEKQSYPNITAASSSAIAQTIAGNSSAAAVTVSTGLSTIDYPRNVIIYPNGSTGDVAACDVVVNGKNAIGQSMSETISLPANLNVASNGKKAFASVTSIVFPANCEDAPYQATFNIGTGESIGVPRCMDNAGDIFFSLLNGAKEGTAPTMAVNASVVESNTADFNGSMNGTNDFILYYMQNYRCTP